MKNMRQAEEKNTIEDVFGSIDRKYFRVENANSSHYVKRSTDIRFDYIHNDDFERKVKAAVRLRSELAKRYNRDSHEKIFNTILEMINSSNENFYLGIMLFLDYLHSERIYPIFSDENIKSSKETQIKNKLIFKILKRAENFLDPQDSSIILSWIHAYAIFFELAYCYKYLYSYDPSKTEKRLYLRYDGKKCNSEYTLDHIEFFLHEILVRICSRNSIDFLVQVEVRREQWTRAEERCVSFKGMQLLILENDRAIKFVILYFVNDVLHFLQEKNPDDYENISGVAKKVQRLFLENNKDFNAVDQKFMWMYLHQLLEMKEYELYGHLLRVSPVMHIKLKDYFEKNRKNYIDRLLEEKDDKSGYLLFALFEREFDKDIVEFESFVREKGLMESNKWLEWFIMLSKNIRGLRKTIDKAALEKLKEEVLDNLKALSGQPPLKQYDYAVQQRIAVLLFDLMIAYVEQDGNLYDLVSCLGENNLLASDKGNWYLMIYIHDNYEGKNWDKIREYLKSLSSDKMWELYTNSAMRFVLSIPEVFSLLSAKKAEANDQFSFEYIIQSISPEEKIETAIKLKTYDHFVDRNYALHPDPNWAKKNYSTLSRRYKKNRVIHGIPTQVCDGVVYVKIDEDIVIDKNDEQTAKMRPDYDKVFEWFELIQNNHFVYNPFILFAPPGKSGDELYKRRVYETDKIDAPHLKCKRSVWYLPVPDDEELKINFAIQIFETMCSCKDDMGSLKRLIHFLADTSMYTISEYHYVIGEKKEALIQSEVLSQRAKNDLERLCSVNSGTDAKHHFELLQNVMNIYANTYLKYYVDIYQLFNELSKSIPLKAFGQVGLVQAYGYEENYYSGLYFNFELCEPPIRGKKQKCYFKQTDVFRGSNKLFVLDEWNYYINKTNIIFCRNQTRQTFKHNRKNPMFLMVDDYQEENYFSNKKRTVSVKDIRTSKKLMDAVNLEWYFKKLCSENVQDEDQKHQLQEQMMKGIEQSLIAMRKLDIFKQLFLARYMDQVLIKNDYDVQVAYDFAKMIENVESKTKMKVFELHKTGYKNAEIAYVRQELEKPAWDFVDNAIEKIKNGQYKLGLYTFQFIFNKFIYKQCIDLAKCKKRVSAGLAGHYSSEDIDAYFAEIIIP